MTKDYMMPQMMCPTCKAVVAITKRGTIAQHTRRVSSHWTYRSQPRRCPSSFQSAGNGYVEWLTSEAAAAEENVKRANDTIADLTVRLETLRGVLADRVATSETIRAALASVTRSVQSQAGQGTT